MSCVGKHYIKHQYNCAHFVAEWYREKLSVEIPVINEFSRSFVLWIRRHFVEIAQPQDHCLVLMIDHYGEYHIGVYYDFGVFHNFKPVHCKGAVVKWTLGAVKGHYIKVSFHKGTF